MGIVGTHPGSFRKSGKYRSYRIPNLEEDTELGRVARRPPPTPLFFVSVAYKGVKYCASPLFATHARWFGSVASKRLRCEPLLYSPPPTVFETI